MLLYLHGYKCLQATKFETDSGLWASVGAWLGASPSPTGTFLERATGVTWLAYVILCAEEDIEREKGVWTQVQSALRHYDMTSQSPDAVTVAAAVKVCKTFPKALGKCL